MLAAVASLGGAAQAAVVVDQESLATATPTTPALVVSRVGVITTSPAPGAPLATQVAVQTFTAGVRGTLNSIDLQIRRGLGEGLLGIGLYKGEATPATALNYASYVAVPSFALPTNFEALNQSRLFTFNLVGSGFRVRPGGLYSLAFAHFPFAPGPNWFNLIVGSGSSFVLGQTPTFNFNQYAGGTFKIYVNGTQTPTFIPNNDVGFRTYVNTSAVPEPAIWAMLILGFGLVGGALRRRAPTGAVHQRSTPLTLPHVRAAV